MSMLNEVMTRTEITEVLVLGPAAPARTRPATTTCIASTALKRLTSGTQHAIHSLSCECREGMLVLRGRVDSYYQKQLAQEAVRKIDGVQRIVNQIEVAKAAASAKPRLARQSA